MLHVSIACLLVFTPVHSEVPRKAQTPAVISCSRDVNRHKSGAQIYSTAAESHAGATNPSFTSPTDWPHHPRVGTQTHKCTRKIDNTWWKLFPFILKCHTLATWPPENIRFEIYHQLPDLSVLFDGESLEIHFQQGASYDLESHSDNRYI